MLKSIFNKFMTSSDDILNFLLFIWTQKYGMKKLTHDYIFHFLVDFKGIVKAKV